jgi:rRNA maturation endonuclease Nob1
MQENGNNSITNSKNKGVEIMHLKFCKRCGKVFRTLFKHGKICDDCNISLKRFKKRTGRKNGIY